MEGIIRKEIWNVISNFEPRAKIVDIRVNGVEDQNGYNVTLTFYLENAATPTTVTIFLERNR